MSQFYGVSGVARKLTREYGEEVIAREITNLFYLGRLDGRRCPVVSGRRLIPDDYVPIIRQVLRERRSSRAKAQGVPTWDDRHDDRRHRLAEAGDRALPPAAEWQENPCERDL